VTQVRYRLAALHGADVVEHVTWVPDGAGWRCSAVREGAGGRLELQLDAAGVTTRLHAEAGGWVLRGGCVGEAVLWRRGTEEGEAVAEGFTGTSPAYALAAVRRLGLAVGECRRLRLVEVTEPVLATRLAEQSWTRVADDRWVADDLATGERREVHVRDGAVVGGTGLTLTHL
jgi:hypothetical protein